MWWTALIPFVLQAIVIACDEGFFHIKRGLPKWERLGHPLDTLTVLICMGYVIWVPFSPATLIGYILLAVFSTIFVTKDEFVHKEHCPATEQWLHAILFTLHPITLTCAGFIWTVVQGYAATPWISNWLNNPEALLFFLLGQFGVMTLFFNLSNHLLECSMEKQACDQAVINNQFYDDLGKEWLFRNDHPIALLRAENVIRVPWILREILMRVGPSAKVLDVGCGGGLLTNPLAGAGYEVTGIDLSVPSLEVAKESDKTESVRYIESNAYSLPFESNEFDVVTAMDILEHVENPNQLIAEASRVLKPGGLFFFHTFNRNPITYWMVIKGVEWCVRNTPANMHVYPLFITPKELENLCKDNDLNIVELIGLQPKVFSWPMLKMLFSRKVPHDFAFQFSKSLKTGYCGIALKTIS